MGGKSQKVMWQQQRRYITFLQFTLSLCDGEILLCDYNNVFVLKTLLCAVQFPYIIDRETLVYLLPD